MENEANSNMQGVSLSQTATLLGKHRSTIRSWIDSGCPVIQRANKPSGLDWVIDLGQMLEWCERRARKAALGEVDQSLGEDQLRREKLANEVALGRYEVARQQEKMIAVDEMAPVIDKKLSALRGKLLALPPKAAPLIRPDDPIAAQELLEGLVYECLEEMIDDDDPADVDLRLAGISEAVEGEEETVPATTAKADDQPVGGRAPKAKPRSKRRTRKVGNGAG